MRSLSVVSILRKVIVGSKRHKMIVETCLCFLSKSPQVRNFKEEYKKINPARIHQSSPYENKSFRTMSSVLHNTEGLVMTSSGKLQCLFPCSRGRLSYLWFTYTWSGWPPGLSGASVCWISWRSCCFAGGRLRASVYHPEGSTGHWEDGASGGRSGPLQCIWSLGNRWENVEVTGKKCAVEQFLCLH